MALFNQEDEFAPAFSYEGYAVYWSTLIVLIHLGFFFLGAILMGTGFAFVFAFTDVSSFAFPQVWRLITYPFFDFGYYQGLGTSFWFLFSAYFMYHCGLQVERFVGGKVYLQLYFGLILISGVVVALLSQFFGVLHLAGVLCVTMGIIAADATIFPDSELSLFPISYSTGVKLLFAINCAIQFAFMDYGDIIGMLTAGVVAYFGMRFAGAGKGMDAIVDWRENRRQAQLSKKIEVQTVRKIEAETTLDTVLEKISQKGMASLSSSEKAILQQASAELKKRDRK